MRRAASVVVAVSLTMIAVGSPAAFGQGTSATTPARSADVIEPRAEAAPERTPIPAAARSTALVDLEDEVMCIVCERPLATSAGDAADDERAVIQGYLDQGLTKQQVKDRLVAEYGKKVLVTGTTPITAAAPIIAGLIGATSVVLLLRRRRQRGQDAPGDGGGSDAPMSSGTDPRPPSPGGRRRNGSSTAQRPDARRNGQMTDEDDARIDAELAERD